MTTNPQPGAALGPFVPFIDLSDPSAAAGPSSASDNLTRAGLYTAPRHFLPPITPMNALALPPLPPIEDHACAVAINTQQRDRSRTPNILELAFLGDAVTSRALVTALQTIRLDGHNGKQTVR